MQAPAAPAGADFKDAVGWLGLEPFGHEGNNKGLGDGLPVADGQRTVFISLGALGRRDELMARHFAHRNQDAGVGDVAARAGELFRHHLLARKGEGISACGHQRRRRSSAAREAREPPNQQ